MKKNKTLRSIAGNTSLKEYAKLLASFPEDQRKFKHFKDKWDITVSDWQIIYHIVHISEPLKDQQSLL